MVCIVNPTDIPQEEIYTTLSTDSCDAVMKIVCHWKILTFTEYYVNNALLFNYDEIVIAL